MLRLIELARLPPLLELTLPARLLALERGRLRWRAEPFIVVVVVEAPLVLLLLLLFWLLGGIGEPPLQHAERPRGCGCVGSERPLPNIVCGLI